MNHFKRIAAFTMAAALTLSLAACDGTAKKDPVQAATEKLSAVKNMEATMSMEMNMSAGGAAMESVTDMDMVIFSDPMKLKVDMDISVSGSSQTMTMYAEGSESEYTMYATADGTTWQSQAVTLDDLAQYDMKAGMNDYLSMSNGFTAAGEEDVDGVKATKYTGVIPGTNMEEVMKNSGALDALGSLEGMLTEEQMKEAFTGLGDLAVTLWIDNSGYPIKYEMDMSGMMSTVMDKLMTAMGQEAGSMTIDKMMISMTCSNFDKAADFEIPAEAKAA